MDKWENVLIEIHAKVNRIEGILTGGNGSGLIKQVQDHNTKIDCLEKETAKAVELEKTNVKVETLEKTTIKKEDVKDVTNSKRWLIGISIPTIMAIVGLLLTIFKK